MRERGPPRVRGIGLRDGDSPDVNLLVREGDIAGDYLERLLDIADFDGDIDMDVEGDRAIVSVVEALALDPTSAGARDGLARARAALAAR